MSVKGQGGFFVIKEDDDTKKTFSKTSDGLIFVPAASFPEGASDEPLNPLGGTLAPLQSTTLKMCLFIFFHTNSSEKCGEVMSDSTPQ
ncbi:hypothetical protein [Lysinibacillus sp. PWR01]|uniref:hypothetical protein n=1 Tax=Lysinibacillus sp. PWR01 TaxID=3342384 RepID=UPI00372D41ED